MMQRTREEVATRALRMIGVAAADEAPTADQMTGALDVLDGIWRELRDEAQPTWDIATGVPPIGFVPLANWLGAELAAEYGVASGMTRARAKLRLLAAVRPDDRCHDCADDPAADYGRGGTIVIVNGPSSGTWQDGGL